MTARIIISMLAAASIMPGVPIEEAFYQILGPDQTTVLCDSRNQRTCDPFLAELDVFEFEAGSGFSMTPYELRADTRFSLDVLDQDSDNWVRVSYLFEEEFDLGWYAFEGTAGETGDFSAIYYVDASNDLGPHVRMSLDPGAFPEPLSGGSEIAVPVTSGQPFHVRGRYRVISDFIFSATGSPISIGNSAYSSDMFLYGRSLTSGDVLDVRIVPVTVPEPSGLALFGAGALLIAVLRRKGTVQ